MTDFVLISPKLDGIDLEVAGRRFDYLRDDLAAAIDKLADKKRPLREPTILVVPDSECQIHYTPSLNAARLNRIKIVGPRPTWTFTLAESYRIFETNDQQHSPLAILERVTAIAGSIHDAIQRMDPLVPDPWTQAATNEALFHAQVYLRHQAQAAGAEPFAFKVKAGRPYRPLQATVEASIGFVTHRYALTEAEARLVDARLPMFASIAKTEKNSDIVYKIGPAELHLSPPPLLSTIDEMKALRTFLSEAEAA